MSVVNIPPVIDENVSEGYSRSIAYLDNLMVTICNFTNGPAGSPEPPHSHPHEQVTYVAEGELIFFRGENEYFLTKGDIITIPSGVPHCIQIKSKRVILVDSFTPIRKIFLGK
jgi:quercetin dioxygenase-like cupin family protein